METSMPRDGSSGAYSRASSAYVANTIISETAVNAEMDDLATAMTASVAKDGQTTMTANLKMGGYRLTGMAAGSAATDSARYDQTVTSTMTTRGDIVQRGASAPERVALGAAGKILSSDGTDAVWGDGPMTTRGDLIVQGETDLGRLALGASGAVLGSDGTDAAWVTNVAKKDSNNSFTEGQTVTKAAADANIIASRTGAGASGAFMGAHNAKAVFGSNTNVQVDYVINGVAKGSLGVSGGYFTPGLTDAGAGTFNTAGYFRNSVALPIQRSNQTSETASTAGSLITLTHGFSAVPSLVQAWAVCKAAEGNYSIGDIVVLNNASNNPSGAASIGIQIFYDTTNCFARVASGGFGLLFDRSTGTAFTPTVSSWNIVLKAWV